MRGAYQEILITSHLFLDIKEDAGRPMLLNNVPSKLSFQPYRIYMGSGTRSDGKLLDCLQLSLLLKYITNPHLLTQILQGLFFDY